MQLNCLEAYPEILSNAIKATNNNQTEKPGRSLQGERIDKELAGNLGIIQFKMGRSQKCIERLRIF